MLKKPKEKGRRHELHIAEILKGFGYKATRTPLSGALPHWQGDITTNFPFFIEAKNQENSSFMEWYRKADQECGSKPPLIAWTKNREEIYCFLLFTDLLMALKGGMIMKQKIKKPEKPKKLTLEETSKLQFSKLKMSGRKKK